MNTQKDLNTWLESKNKKAMKASELQAMYIREELKYKLDNFILI